MTVQIASAILLMTSGPDAGVGLGVRGGGAHPSWENYLKIKIKIFLRFAPPFVNTLQFAPLFQKASYGPGLKITDLHCILHVHRVS